MKKLLSRIIAAMSIAILLLASTETKVDTTSGNISVANNIRSDYQYVVGVWVEVDGGRSGWAELPNTRNNAYWKYNIPSGKKYRLHIWIGGTRQEWGTTVISHWSWKTNDGLQVNIVPTNNIFANIGIGAHYIAVIGNTPY